VGESETTALASAGTHVSRVTNEYELDYIRTWEALLDDCSSCHAGPSSKRSTPCAS